MVAKAAFYLTENYHLFPRKFGFCIVEVKVLKPMIRYTRRN